MKQYAIFFDTNTLLYLPTNTYKQRLLKRIKDTDELLITFFIPEIVKKEYKRQIKINVDEAVKQINSANKNIKKHFPQKAQEDIVLKDSDYDKYIFEPLHKLEFVAIPTPFDRINFRQLFDKAIDYLPPFTETEKEKGFKDAAIAQTVIEFINDNTNFDKFIFACDDKNLCSYIETLNLPKLFVYHTLEDLESSIHGDVAKISEKRRLVLNKEAQKAFYTQGNKGSLFFLEQVEQKILEKSNPYISSPSVYSESLNTTLSLTEAFGWKKQGETTIQIKDTKFNSLIENMYEWSTTIECRQQYTKSTDNTGIATFQTFRTVEFTMHWNVLWKSTEDFTQKDVTKIDLINTEAFKIVPFYTSFMGQTSTAPYYTTASLATPYNQTLFATGTAGNYELSFPITNAFSEDEVYNSLPTKGSTYF